MDCHHRIGLVSRPLVPLFFLLTTAEEWKWRTFPLFVWHRYTWLCCPLMNTDSHQREEWWDVGLRQARRKRRGWVGEKDLGLCASKLFVCCAVCRVFQPTNWNFTKPLLSRQVTVTSLKRYGLRALHQNTTRNVADETRLNSSPVGVWVHFLRPILTSTSRPLSLTVYPELYTCHFICTRPERQTWPRPLANVGHFLQLFRSLTCGGWVNICQVVLLSRLLFNRELHCARQLTETEQ